MKAVDRSFESGQCVGPFMISELPWLHFDAWQVIPEVTHTALWTKPNLYSVSR